MKYVYFFSLNGERERERKRKRKEKKEREKKRKKKREEKKGVKKAEFMTVSSGILKNSLNP